MISTSALVLTALTVTGLYMRNHTKNSLDNGYTIDFTALEDRADDKLREITNNSKRDRDFQVAEGENGEGLTPPVEAGSNEIKIPGLTDQNDGQKSSADQSSSLGMSNGADSKNGKTTTEKQSGKGAEADQGKQGGKTTAEGAGKSDDKPAEDSNIRQTVDNSAVLPEDRPTDIVETASDSPVILDKLHFDASQLVKPVSGDPLIHYSMNHSVYFATLDQYKYNPAVIYSASQGETVFACAAGRVLNVHNDAELGHVLVLDLGDGYQAVYGQLENIEVPIGGSVEAGMKLATVAAPTKYFSVEGSNLYFKMTKDGESIDPEQFFQ